MVIGIAFMVVAVLIIGIWILIELKRLRHKMFALFLIGLILFLYITMSFTFKDQNINFESTDGIIKAGKIYFAWIGSAFQNVKTISGNALNMDWSTKNETDK